MNRKQRRDEARKMRLEEQEQARRAALEFAKDLKRTGDYDPQKALNNPFYMANVTTRKKEERKKWEQHGITQADVDDAWKRGYRRASNELSARYEILSFAACGLAMHKVCGFGKQRINKVLEEMYRVIMEELTKEDLVKRLERETGIELTFSSVEEIKNSASLEARMDSELELEGMEI